MKHNLIFNCLSPVAATNVKNTRKLFIGEYLFMFMHCHVKFICGVFLSVQFFSYFTLDVEQFYFYFLGDFPAGKAK